MKVRREKVNACPFCEHPVCRAQRQR
jgi:hypothetical protein